jgi:hypothetical protein
MDAFEYFDYTGFIDKPSREEVCRFVCIFRRKNAIRDAILTHYHSITPYRDMNSTVFITRALRL